MTAAAQGTDGTNGDMRPFDLVAVAHPRTALSRTAALAKAELQALARNKVSVFYAVAFSPLLVLGMASMPFFTELSAVIAGDLTTLTIAMLAVFGITMAVYFNLTTAAVARRESLTIKRHLAGQPRAREVLAAIAVPNLLILVAQVTAVAVVTCLAIEVPPLTNPLLAVLGVLLGGVAFALLAFLTSATTRTVESAQLTTMPGMLVGLLVSGVIVPMSAFPDAVAAVLVKLPVYPVVELVTIGLGGTTVEGEAVTLGGSFLAAAPSVLVLLAWIVVLGWCVGRFMRYEPRR